MTDKKDACILIIDDLQMNLDMASKALEKKYAIMTALSGEDGFEKLLANRNQIDLILLDIVLPQMDGFMFMEKMKQEGLRRIPVIIMTADHETKTEVKALKNGAADFIRKPLYHAILQNRVENVLMRNQIEYDTLTGLYNRSRTFRKIQEMVYDHPGEKFAFLRYDIDNFSIYNSSMGEAEGNKLLVTVADILKKMAKDHETCVYGRIDGDVFCTCEIYNKEIMEQHIEQAVRYVENYRDDYRLESSFGIYIFDNADVSIERVYTNASLAAHTCKGIFDKYFAYYEDWMSARYSDEREVINEMMDALSQRQFVTYLQPKYDLNTDEPCGAEALVRWMHPTKGMISPGKFIPVFERNGFIAKLDYYMWDDVCSIIEKWQTEGRKIYPISVNMSRISMYNPHISHIMLELIEKHHLTPDLLQLEITESAYMTSPDLMKATIRALQDNGFTILMDDFGSGYSSLNTLKEIQVDILKVDMKFLPNGDDALRAEKILSSVIRMADWLGMPTIAEGVETEAHRDFLKEIGCDYVQGYFYAKPMPVAEYEQLIEDSHLMVEKEKKVGFSSAAWSSDEKINDILTGIQLPVAIVEFASKRTEIIRFNHAFGDLFEKGFKDNIDVKEREKLLRVFEQAAMGEMSEGEFTYNTSAGQNKYFQIKVRCLEKTLVASLLCAIIVDITNEKKYEIQLKKLEEIVPSNKRTKMLVIDDSKFVRNMVRMIFGNTYDVCEAEDGMEGLGVLEEQKGNIAVILLDMVMPVMDGRQFLLEKNKMNQVGNIPVIVMSTESDAERQLDMLALGVNDYITKPFDKRIFKQKVENAILFAERFVEIRKEYTHALADDVEV